MKHFILTLLMLVGFTFNAQALNFVVEDDDTETEVAAAEEPTQTEDENVLDESTDEDKQPTESVTETAVAEEPTTQEPTPQEETVEEDDEEEEEKEDEKVYLAVTDVKNNLAAVRAVSYCSGAFVLYNSTKRNVQEISGSIGFGDQKKNFKFTNVKPGASIGWPIQIVGKACESIFAMPDLQINKCQIERMSDKKCRTKLIFVPIPTQPR